jgi:hypothetical protein
MYGMRLAVGGDAPEPHGFVEEARDMMRWR